MTNTPQVSYLASRFSRFREGDLGKLWGLATKLEIDNENLWMRLENAVNAECSCGGRTCDDPDACPACKVWHRVTLNLGKEKGRNPKAQPLANDEHAPSIGH